MTAYLIFGMTYAFAAAVQPGPFLTYLVSQTLTNGWRRTVPAAFAPLLSDIPIIALVLLVLSHMPTWLVQVLQFAGGIFLLYLALGAYKTWRNYEKEKPIGKKTIQQTVLKAAVVNLLNPAPYLGWSLVMGPLLLKGWRQALVSGIALLAGFYSILIFVTLGIMLRFSAARKTGPRISRALVGLSAMALTLFGLYEICLGIKAVWGI
ncbi:MAG: LysE family transporter [Anaerolineales bacterium]|jgi:threonine/homoserine/homoserine lactone efflux protein